MSKLQVKDLKEMLKKYEEEDTIVILGTILVADKLGYSIVFSSERQM